MLRELSADDPRFRTANFGPGLNLVVADRTATSGVDQTRNAVGKSSLVELLHFLLGGRPPTDVKRPENRETTFRLRMDWPGRSEPFSVRRSGADASNVLLAPDVATDEQQDSPLLWEPSERHVTLQAWRDAIARGLFGIAPDNEKLSERMLLSFTMRRSEAGGFHDALRPNTQVPRHQAITHLCYLLGLDWRLASRYTDLAEHEKTRKKLAEAVKDPSWDRIIGNAANLRGTLAAVEQRIAELRDSIDAFHVVPEYEELQQEADRIHARIKELRDDDAVHRRNLEEIEAATEDVNEPGYAYLEDAYAELGMVLGSEVRARFDEVREFHQAVVRNRRQHLEEEAQELRERLTHNEAEREQLGERQAELLRTLNAGGALETLTQLQRRLGEAEAERQQLQQQLKTAREVERTKDEITRERAALKSEVETDIAERQQRVTAISQMFNRFARELYGNERRGFLQPRTKDNSFTFDLQIESDGSKGISNMKIFCFDLTCAVFAHRDGRGPGFLVHDSALFDGVDERQTAHALRLASRVAEEEGMQYIVTMNSDDLDNTKRFEFDPEPYIVPPRLNDQQDGGLFGFRF